MSGTNAARAPAQERKAEDRLESVDLVFRLLELLAGSPQPRTLGDIARALDISKPRAHRHLRALVHNDYARQDADSERYEISAGLIRLGEEVRGRLSFGGAARPAMERLRQLTGQAVTASAPVDGQVTIVELLRGRTIVQFAVRPGTVMDPARSAHGRIALAFGAPGEVRCETPASEAVLAQVRAQGWATAPNGIVTGVDALAAPVFGHDGGWRGAVAIVGSVDEIAPKPRQIDGVMAAAREVSERLGWTEKT